VAADSARQGAKQRVRERMWRLLERRGVARFPGARGRIPNFVGAEAAADRLAEQPEWRAARVIKANPDAPQLPVRARALADGKRVYMAVPRLAAEKPFLLLDPARLRTSPRAAASIGGASAAGIRIAVEDVARLDLIVCGTVAVDSRGVRVGKGGGYSDLEFALLAQSGAVDHRTLVATTVHDAQLVLSSALPYEKHDFRVDLVATPSRVLRFPRRRRPAGIIWSDLTEAKVAEVPALVRLSAKRSSPPAARRGRGGART
jgi:5-formyltetrahydrofolate cyclo-ligase